MGIAVATNKTVKMHAVAVVGIVLLCLIKDNQGLKCHVCDTTGASTGGTKDAKCVDPFPADRTPTECAAGKDTCLKSKDKDNKVVIRQCIEAANCKEASKDGNHVKCCKTDGCNGATSFHISSFLLLPALTLVYMYK